jgi:hypothetical protein
MKKPRIENLLTLATFNVDINTVEHVYSKEVFGGVQEQRGIKVCEMC